MDGKVNVNVNDLDKAIIPSYCLKAKASSTELEAKRHLTVVSGWFSEPESCSGKARKRAYFNNPMWLGEAHSMKVEKILYKDKSEYQEILVFESSTYGKVLVLDGIVQLTEKDECVYQEMITHLSLCSIQSPKITVEVYIDDMVMKSFRRHALFLCMLSHFLLAPGFSGPSVRLIEVAQVVEFLRNVPEGKYDAIVVDSSDPVGIPSLERALCRSSEFCVLASSLEPGFLRSSVRLCLVLDLRVAFLGSRELSFARASEVYHLYSLSFILVALDGHHLPFGALRP
ncbi:Spermine synthase, partial [Camellia lanceoleosa]